MASGTPFVAPRTGCIPRYRAGGAVKSESEVEVADSIGRMSSDASYWTQLSEAGRAHILTNCDSTTVARNLVATLGLHKLDEQN